LRGGWRRSPPPGVNPDADAAYDLAGYLEKVIRSRPARWFPNAGSTYAPLPVKAVRWLVLVGVLVTVPFAEPHPGAGNRGVGVAVALGVAAASGVFWLLSERSMHRTVAALAVLGLAGGVLAALSPLSPAIAVGCVVAAAAGIRLSTETSLAITAGIVAAFLAAGLATGAPTETLLGYPFAWIGLWGFGLTRHAYLLRAEQAERTLAEARRAHEAETHAAALAERARMAREIHDVLAHSLAAVSVNLQAAEGLLDTLPEGNPELARAIECVSRAGVLTREGLAEARRAIQALRDDAAPLADQLSALAKEWEADSNVPVDFTISGSPRPLNAEVGLAAYRTAQEALTNARKHAPGQPVRLSLEFSSAEIAVQVANGLLPAVSGGGPPERDGTGYGLTGLRERAALGGGTLVAGPADGEWQVSLRIPA
jgi:signal transduction histidine kinase